MMEFVWKVLTPLAWLAIAGGVFGCLAAAVAAFWWIVP